MPDPPVFDEAFQRKLHELLSWRRDVRRFRTTPLPAGVLERLIQAADLAPSVGFSQPWRFVVVDDPGLRESVIDNFRLCNAQALAGYDPAQAVQYAKLKLAGLQEAPCHLAVFSEDDTKVGHGLGRQTMPETTRYSAVAAICNLWLAARAEGIGVGWVSILDPERITTDLATPAAWTLIGYLCIGYPEREDDRPELERAGWERRSPAATRILQR
jgi:5,6-dimethylbenzimidazole synthase